LTANVRKRVYNFVVGIYLFSFNHFICGSLEDVFVLLNWYAWRRSRRPNHIE